MEPDQVEQAIDAMVDGVAILPVNPEPILDDALELQRFIEDVAQKIHKPDVIAQRYGFASAGDMLKYITDNQEVRRRIKVRRAIFESDTSVDTRNRRYAGHMLLEALPHIGSVMFDKAAPHGAKMDAAKLTARIAGVDGLPPAPKEGGGGVGNQFTLNFHFSGNRVERITTTVVEPEMTALPPAEDLQ